MAYASVLSLAKDTYATLASDDSYYTSDALDVSAVTDLLIAFTPVINGIAAPFLVIYAVDLFGQLVPIGRCDQSNPCVSLGRGSGTPFGAKIQVKGYAGLSTPPLEFALSIEGKGVA